MFDVYCYGMITASTVHLIDDAFVFPKPNGYAEIRETMYSVGGEAVNSAVVLSKLGLKIKFDGNWLNKKTAGKVFELLEPYDIDLSSLKITDEFGTEEIVITDKTTRTVFGNYAAFHSGLKQWNAPSEEDIRNSKIAALDPYFKDESREAAKLCLKNNIRYVTLDCPFDDYMAQNAAAIVISHELKDKSYPNEDLVSVFKKYQESCKGLIIFTFGENELWYARKGEEMKKFTPYKINPVDTTGAGDSFRGGIVYGLLNEWNDEDVVDFASALAACVCLSIPHTLNAPGLEGILSFMKEHKK